MSFDWPPVPRAVDDPDGSPFSAPGDRIKVLHVVTRFEAGAGGNTLLSAIGMDPARYDVWIAGAPAGPLWGRAEAAGIQTVRLQGMRREVSAIHDLDVLRRLIALIRRERFDIVHAHNAKGGFLGRLAAFLCRTPGVVYTLHGRDPWWPVAPGTPEALATELMRPFERRAFLALERMLRPTTDSFVAVAPKVAEHAVRVRIATADRIEVIPSAVEIDAALDDPHAGVRKEFGIQAGARLIGTAGRLDAQKAPLDFVRMAAAVASRHPQTRFVMVGAGELEREIAAEAARLDVDVRVTGFRTDASRLIAAMDVFVISSLYEGLGRALTEALAAARPVVATAVDGVVDLVRPGVTGLLATAGQPATLAEGVLWMLEHPDEARAMGQAARSMVRPLFAPSLMCSMLDATYVRLLGRASRAGEPPASVSSLDERRRTVGRAPAIARAASPRSGHGS